jgi:hypothetical protein
MGSGMLNKRAVVTIVSRNYLAQSLILCDSLAEHHGDDVSRYIFVIDELSRDAAAAVASRGIQLLSPSDLAIPGFRALVFAYNVVEACTAVKPFVLSSLLGRGHRKVIYLDPDIRCYDRLDAAWSALDEADIVLTPHATTPLPSAGAPFDDRLFLRFGVYNLGFIGVATAARRPFLEWWSARLLRFGVARARESLFVDQKWIDLAPAFFPRTWILRHLGYNVAYWNLHERRLCPADKGFQVVESGEPLVFFHFSSPDLKNLRLVSKSILGAPGEHLYSLAHRSDISPLFEEYAALLKRNGHETYSKLAYGYSTYDNGEVIGLRERAHFWETNGQDSYSDPFSCGPDSYWSRARRLGFEPVGGGGPASAGHGVKPRQILRRILRTIAVAIARRIGYVRYDRVISAFVNATKVTAEDVESSNGVSH